MCVVGVAWLRRGAAGMAGLVKRPAAPGGGLRDRRGRGRGSRTRGESQRALVFGDECTMLVCFSFVSSSQPASPPTTCTKTSSRGASPSSSSRSCEKNRTRRDAREEPKGPGPSPGSTPGSLRAPPRPRHPGGRPGQSPHQPGCAAPSAAAHHRHQLDHQPAEEVGRLQFRT